MQSLRAKPVNICENYTYTLAFPGLHLIIFLMDYMQMCDYIDKWEKEKGKMHRGGYSFCNSSEMSNSDSDNRSRIRNAKIFKKELLKKFFIAITLKMI